MDHLLKSFALHCGLSLSTYWHLRLVAAVSLVPVLVSLYLAVESRRRPRPPYSLWVGPDGRLVARPEQVGLCRDKQ